MKKKGQITIFIIIGMIFVSSILLFFVFRDSFSLEKIPVNAEPVYSNILSCLEQVAENGLYTLGWQGGLISFDEEKMMIAYFSTITYAYDEGVKTFPSIEEMESELEAYANIGFKECFENKTYLDGWEVKEIKMNTDVFSTEDSVVFDINSPLVIEKNQTTQRIKDMSIEIPVRLSHIHSVISKIIDVQVEDPGWVPYTYLNDFDLNATIYPYRENNFIYEFVDNQSLIDSESFQFLVANKFKERDMDEVINEII